MPHNDVLMSRPRKSGRTDQKWATERRGERSSQCNGDEDQGGGEYRGRDLWRERSEYGVKKGAL